jgi:hypothetical protein
MNDRETPAADSTLLALLRFDASRSAGASAKARVLHRVQATIAGVGMTPNMADEARAPGQASSSLPAPSSPVLSAPRASTALGWLEKLAAKPIGLAMTAFCLGGLSGAGVYAVVAPSKTRTLYVEYPISVPEPNPFASRGGTARSDSAARRQEASSGAPDKIAKGGSARDSLAAERTLLDGARKDLARGESAGAARTLEAHARRYPTGLLQEEREALTIKALVDEGRTDEARRRGAKFKERFPRSLFGPAVDEALGVGQ